MPFHGIIFDFNGVLWWDTHLQEQAWQQFTREKTGKALSAEEIATHIHGRTNQHTMDYAFGRTLPPAELSERIQQKESIYRALCLAEGDGFRLSPGAIDLLDFLVERRIPHTIATASEKTNLDFFIQHLNLSRWFDIDRIVYDNGTRPGKPAPDIYIQAARNLGLIPEQCVVVEDSRSGIQAAHAAMIGHVVAIGPAETHDTLAQLPGVDRVITRLSDLPSKDLFA